MGHVVYLHGFASSPGSTKARFFDERLAETGKMLLCPDFNQPEFSTLTISRMLSQLKEHIEGLPAGEIALIGSSLGGFVAVEAAARRVGGRRHRISSLVLLAPAVELEWDRWSEIGPGGIDRWRKTGHIEVFHYAQDRPAKLKFDFYEDARRYRPGARRLNLPLLIFQGRRDESVSPAIVQRFAHRQPHATLHMLEDDHQLKGSLDFIWGETSRFLQIRPDP